MKTIIQGKTIFFTQLEDKILCVTKDGKAIAEMQIQEDGNHCYFLIFDVLKDGFEKGCNFPIDKNIATVYTNQLDNDES